MSFSFHSDVSEHEVFGKLSNAAFGLWVKPGTWTSAHQSPAFVPDRGIEEISDGTDVSSEVNELVNAGAWTRVSAGYHMEYGPSNDVPLPVWRYDEGSPVNVQGDQFLAGVLQADLKPLDLTQPTVGAGLLDPVGEVARDLDQARSLGG